MDSTLDHSHLATEVQHGENELHMRKQCDTYAKLEIRTDTTLESHGKLYAKVSHIVTSVKRVKKEQQTEG